MAIGTHGASRAATVAHISVDKSTGKITIVHLYRVRTRALRSTRA